VFTFPPTGQCAEVTQGAYTDGNGLEDYYQSSGCPDTTPKTMITYVSQDSVVAQSIITGIQNFNPALQREDGSYIGTNPSNSEGSVSAINSGGLLWQTPIPSGPSGNQTIPLYATSDGGIVVTNTYAACAPGNISLTIVGYACQSQPTDPTPRALPSESGAGQLGTLYTLDQNGNVTSQTADLGTVYSWTGNWYADPVGSVSNYSFPLLNLASSFWPIAGANASGNSVAALRETLYVRSFAPWPWFGTDPFTFPPCATDCFRGDNRSFSTDTTATARVTAIVDILLPNVVPLIRKPFSDLSYDKNGNHKTGTPTSTVQPTGKGSFHLEMAGSNPLVPFGVAPDIDTKLDITGRSGVGQICYSGHLYGDAFPNSEVFIVNSQHQATMLITFSTPLDRNFGPFTLYGSGNANMGIFASTCVSN
jgi:hypothetical protein